MLDEEFRAGAWSLIVGSLLTILVFAFHPSHIDPRPLIGPFTLSQIVHGTAIIAAPLILFGMLEMARWISFGDWRVRLGLIVAMFAMVLTLAAAVVSNFVTPAAVRASYPGLMPMGHGAQAGHAGGVMQMPPLVQLSVALNRGLAQVHVALLSIAIILLGTALFRRNRTLAVAGMMSAHSRLSGSSAAVSRRRQTRCR